LSDWLLNLNSEQKTAALHNHGPMLILAGAGSGKTTVLISRTGRLIEEKIVAPENICVLTFTNKAARELKHRVAQKIPTLAKKIHASTFHSFGLQLIKKYYKELNLPKQFGVLDPGDSRQLLKELLQNHKFVGKDAFDLDKLSFVISKQREQGKRVTTDDEYELMAIELLPKYQHKKILLGVVDFDDLILLPIQLMTEFAEIKNQIQETYQQFMVDEFQDTNQTQMKLVRLLADKYENITVVGDDDQSIYGWRGAQVKNILEFPKTYPACKVVKLEQNYRSTFNILNLANTIIQKNTHRHDKKLKTTGQQGDLPELFVLQNETEEIEFVTSEILSHAQKGVPYKDIAVLYRVNSQADALEPELRKMNIPYHVTGGTSLFDKKEIRDMVAYLKCALQPNDVSLRRIINVPPRGIGDKTIERLITLSTEKQISFLNATKIWKESDIDDSTGASIEQLLQVFQELPKSLVAENQTLMQFCEKIGYKEYLSKSSSDALQFHKRLKLIEIFSNYLSRYLAKKGFSNASLKDFIELMTLRDEEDEVENKVQLMTLHACKGLEFPIVFLVGLEEDILPHKTLGKEIAEERRLLYVGITRAEEKLTLTRCQNRTKYGKAGLSAPSRFLLECPETLFKTVQGPRPISNESRKSLISDLFKKLDSLDDKTRTTNPTGT
jgi:DNA helicase-2/ATP-dependent DNA helicase PcrA